MILIKQFFTHYFISGVTLNSKIIHVENLVWAYTFFTHKNF